MVNMILSIVGLALFVVALYFAYEIFKSSRDKNKKIIWILIVLLVPFGIGSALYWFMERKKV